MAIRSILAALALAVASASGYAQTSPGWSYGFTPTAQQWNAAFAAKQDYLGYRPINSAGDSMRGRLSLTPSTTAGAGVNIGVGAAPLAPKDGDLWVSSIGMFYRAAGTIFTVLAPPACNGVMTWDSASGAGCVTFGSGVLPALAQSVGTAGGFLQTSGALGTPVSGNLQNTSGYLVSSLAGAGSGVLAALGANVGSAGAFVLNGGTMSGETIVGGSINGAPIGGATPAAGSFTTLAASTPIAVASGGTGAATASANTIFAAPNGSSGAPGFRHSVCADLPAGAWCKINSTTVTGAGALSDTTSFAGGFAHYVLKYDHVTFGTSGSILALQVYVDGVLQTSGYVGGTGSYIYAAYQGGYGPTTGPGISGVLFMDNPADTTQPKNIEGHAGGFYTTGSYLSGTVGGAYTGGNGAITGVLLGASSGTISGTLTVYGYN